MPRSMQRDTTARTLDERYLEFHAKSGAAFAQYPQVEPLRLFLFRRLLVHRRPDGLTDHVKRWLRPFLKRAHTRLADRPADVLIWVESQREVISEALLPVYHELVARGVDTELVSFYGPRDLPVAARVFVFPARARAPQWAREAWEAMCSCEVRLRARALEHSFYHACAMLQGLYDQLQQLLDSISPKVVVCAATQPAGGAALMVVARQRGIQSLLLQHGMAGPDFTPLLADAMLMWGPSSEDVMVSYGLPRARLLAVGSPRHDSMRPSSTGQARAALLRTLDRPERPTFVFFSGGHDPERIGAAAVECAGWLERLAAHYGDALNVVVRLHPNEDGALYRGCRHLAVMSRTVDLRTTLEGCDWIGSVCSTVLYDALLFGKPTWQFHADHWPVLADNWKTGLAVRVSSERRFSEMVRDVLSTGPAGRVDEALVARVFANHGHATRAVADVVESRLGTERRLAEQQTACDRSW